MQGGRAPATFQFINLSAPLSSALSLDAFCCPPLQQAESERKVETRPSDTLFVVNFDVQRVRERDVERFFDGFGRINRVEIRKNFAFVQVWNAVARECQGRNLWQVFGLGGG